MGHTIEYQFLWLKFVAEYNRAYGIVILCDDTFNGGLETHGYCKPSSQEIW